MRAKLLRTYVSFFFLLWRASAWNITNVKNYVVDTISAAYESTVNKYYGYKSFPADIRFKTPQSLFDDIIEDRKPGAIKISLEHSVNSYSTALLSYTITQNEVRVTIFCKEKTPDDAQEIYMKELLTILETISTKDSIISIAIEDVHIFGKFNALPIDNLLLPNVLSLKLTGVTSCNDSNGVNSILKFLALFPKLEILVLNNCNLHMQDGARPIHSLKLPKRISSLRIVDSKGATDADNLLNILPLHFLRFLWLDNSHITSLNTLCNNVLYKQENMEDIWINNEQHLAEIKFQSSKLRTNHQLSMFSIRNIHNLRKENVDVDFTLLPNDSSIYFLIDEITSPANSAAEISSILDRYNPN
ncbi:hypothetical protein NEAUS03_0162 [Nematocida ausubeli]|nr:hypothetical protein NEAUS03_0162 [Nematocida ausubeli]